MKTATIAVGRRSAFKIVHIGTQYDPGSKALPLTITDGDIEGKPVPGTAYSTHLEFLEAYLTSDGKFNIPAYTIEFFQFQGFCVLYLFPASLAILEDLN